MSSKHGIEISTHLLLFPLFVNVAVCPIRTLSRNGKAIRGNENPDRSCEKQGVQSKKVLCRILTGQFFTDLSVLSPPYTQKDVFAWLLQFSFIARFA